MSTILKIIKQNYKLQLGKKLLKHEIIQSLKTEVPSLQKRVVKLESQVRLLEDALIINEIKINNADQYSRRKNIVMQTILQSV